MFLVAGNRPLSADFSDVAFVTIFAVRFLHHTVVGLLRGAVLWRGLNEVTQFEMWFESRLYRDNGTAYGLGDTFHVWQRPHVCSVAIRSFPPFSICLFAHVFSKPS